MIDIYLSMMKLSVELWFCCVNLLSVVASIVLQMVSSFCDVVVLYCF